jgi:hypothetical protein
LFTDDAEFHDGEGRRVVFDAMCQMRFRGERICHFYEVIDSGASMAQLGFDGDRMVEQLSRRAERLRAGPELKERLDTEGEG